jgi:hypothetical protein
MNGKGTTADGPITSNRVQISTNPQKSFASRSLRRKQIAGLVKRVSQHFNAIANINGDVLNIEEGVRLVSLASLLESLAVELATTEQHNGAAREEICNGHNFNDSDEDLAALRAIEATCERDPDRLE